MRKIILDDLPNESLEDEKTNSQVSGPEAAALWEQTFWGETFTESINNSSLKLSEDLARIWVEIEVERKVSRFLRSATKWLKEKEESFNPTKVIKRQKIEKKTALDYAMTQMVSLENLGYHPVCKIATVLDIQIRHTQGKLKGKLLPKELLFQIPALKNLESMTYGELSDGILLTLNLRKLTDKAEKVVEVSVENFDAI